MNTQEKILSRAVRIPEAGCWLWTGSLFNTGYAALRANGRARTVHRLSYELFKGPIPNGMCVMHTCDVRCCVNPEHLKLGTLADNNADMRAKDRHSHGERHPRYGKRGRRGAECPTAKLSERQVAEIRASRESGRALEGKYGVTRRTIDRIRAGQSWND